jgi:hypothetical protein
MKQLNGLWRSWFDRVGDGQQSGRAPSDGDKDHGLSFSPECFCTFHESTGIDLHVH